MLPYFWYLMRCSLAPEAKSCRRRLAAVKAPGAADPLAKIVFGAHREMDVSAHGPGWLLSRHRKTKFATPALGFGDHGSEPAVHDEESGMGEQPDLEDPHGRPLRMAGKPRSKTSPVRVRKIFESSSTATRWFILSA